MLPNVTCWESPGSFMNDIPMAMSNSVFWKVWNHFWTAFLPDFWSSTWHYKMRGKCCIYSELFQQDPGRASPRGLRHLLGPQLQTGEVRHDRQPQSSRVTLFQSRESETSKVRSRKTWTLTCLASESRVLSWQGVSWLPILTAESTRFPPLISVLRDLEKQAERKYPVSVSWCGSWG